MKRIYILIILLSFSISLHLDAQVTFKPAFPNLDFSFPVELLPANDGSSRLFLVEQRGVIYVFPNDSNVTENDREVFLDIENIVGYQEGSELGLLGMAFHPDYTNNGFVYLYYTIGKTNVSQNLSASVRLERYQVDPSNPDRLDPNTAFILFEEQKNIPWSNHNGGKILFGPDDYLYMSIGDGGGGGDPALNGQNLNTIYGKILRIDVDVDGSNPAATSGNFEIPSDNPRVGKSGRDEIYAWGIRNTWKMAFDPVTNHLWGADVGQGRLEEINLIELGGNYGWNRFEADRIEDGSTTADNALAPLSIYDHRNGDLSITGGYVYRGNEIPELIGEYIYGDYVSGRVWALKYDSIAQDTSNQFLFRADGTAIPTFGQDEAGELYFTSYSENAQIFKIISGESAPPGAVVPGVGQITPFLQGTDGLIRTLAMAPDGEVAIGGDFEIAANVSANNIIIWNNQSGWRTLGSGTNGEVLAMAYDANGNLYIGGNFTEINGQAANYIALWDGENFSALGSGTNGPVAALAINNAGQVFAGGAFETAGGLEVGNIALWDNAWQTLTDAGTGLNGTNNEIRSMGMDASGNLYVGGNFAQAAGKFASAIARWDGNNWTSLGDGTSGFVQAIAINDDYLYAGGNFALAGGNTVNRIARWNFQSQTWEGLGNGLSGVVTALVLDGPYVYAGGGFATAANSVNTVLQVNNMARWSENANWQALGEGNLVGSDGPINSMLFSSGAGENMIYIGGNFTQVNGQSASDFAFWTEDSLLTSLPAFAPEELKLYPNPTQGQLNLEFDNLYLEELKVQIWSRHGRLIREQTLSLNREQGKITLDLKDLSEDTYIIRIQNKERASSFKVLRAGK